MTIQTRSNGASAEAEANEITLPKDTVKRMVEKTMTDEDQALLAAKRALEPDNQERLMELALRKHLEDAALLERSLSKRKQARGEPSISTDQPFSNEKLGLKTLSEFSIEAPPPMLIDKLDPEGHTIVFGDGGVGKGTLTAQWLIRLTAAGRKPLLLDYENHPDEWSRRIHGLGGSVTRETVPILRPNATDWDGPQGSILQHKEAIRWVIEDGGYDYVVVDSIGVACGDPNSVEAANDYAKALQYLGVPSLSLAHITKAKDLTKPYGSGFWHNLARMTISAERKNDLMVLKWRKNNNYKRPPALAIEVHWNEAGLPVEFTERPYRELIGDMIYEVLTRAMKTTEIRDALNEERDEGDDAFSTQQVSDGLSRDRLARFEQVGRGRPAIWRRRGSDDELGEEAAE